MKRRLIRFVAMLGLTLLPFSAALAADVNVTQPWARATPAPGGAGAAFMTITNTGDSADTLVKAATPVANVAELHTHTMEGGVMRMTAVPAVEVPASGAATLAPGGLHVMLIGLKAPLTEGSSFPLTLTFAHAGEVTVTVPVLAPGAMGPGGAAGAMAPGGHMMPGGMPPMPHKGQ